MEKDLGNIEKGTIANLVLLDADPVSDIHNTTKISEVFLGGKEFDRPALDQMLKSAEAAAKSATINWQSSFACVSMKCDDKRLVAADFERVAGNSPECKERSQQHAKGHTLG
jgi:hypothetical protein